MKRSEIKALKDMDAKQLEEKLKDLSVQLTSAYLAKNARKLNNTSMVRTIRTDIARIKTVLNNKGKENN